MATVSMVKFIREGLQVYADVYLNKAELTEVLINGTWRKVISSTENRINLTPYLRSAIELNAYMEEGDSLNAGRSVNAQVEINGTVYSDELPYLYGVPIQGYCSDLPYRLIAPGQRDLLSGAVMSGGELELYVDRDLVHRFMNEENGRLLCWVVYQQGEKSANEEVELRICDDRGYSELEIPIRYVVRPMGVNGKRLAWVNRYGALEFWNFDYLREQTLTTAYDTLYTDTGYQKQGLKAEKHYIVESRELPQDVLEVLSYILASPKVWLVDDRCDVNEEVTFEEIDIITDECKVFSDTDLLSLQLTYRKAKRDIW